MNIRLEILDDDIYQLTFDRPGSSANVFDRATLAELQEHLTALSGDTRMRGLVFASAKKSIFIAGADIRELLSGTLPEAELREMVREGQRVFNRIAALRVPTVAAIHGAALGGGFELCLACDYRVATDDRSTKIGLPETSLGIVPGWGGCTRLPRLIGLPKALDVILKGRRLAAIQALKHGMVDEVVPREYLARRAAAKVSDGKARRSSRALLNNALVAGIIARRLGPDLAKKTRGHYPAVPRALKVVTEGISQSVARSLELEERAICELAATEVCRNLVRVFFLQERAKGLRPRDVGGEEDAPVLPQDKGPVAVIGAGVMGAGIAQWISSRGRHVILRDVGEEPLLKGMASIGKLFADGVKRHLFDRTEARQGLDRISPSAREVPLTACGFVIEAAVENMEIKKKIFSGLLARTSADTVLATNTSALSIGELGESIGAADRVIGMHFFNPVSRMQPVEIVVGERTSPRTLARTLRFVQAIGKLPVVVKDKPGFVVNRVLMPYLTEAGHLFERGALVRELDEAMLDFGMPMGPMRLIDEVGVDVAHHVASFFSATFGDRMPTPVLLKGMMDRNLLGRKTGAGFYVYDHPKKEPRLNESVNVFAKSEAARSLTREALQERMVLVMLNEAARCIEEGVAAAPEDVDFAMIMGTGFAPFRGGPLRHADALGAKKIVAGLTRLAEREDPRFAPCERLRAMAEKDETFYRE